MAKWFGKLGCFSSWAFQETGKYGIKLSGTRNQPWLTELVTGENLSRDSCVWDGAGVCTVTCLGTGPGYTMAWVSVCAMGTAESRTMGFSGRHRLALQFSFNSHSYQPYVKWALAFHWGSLETDASRSLLCGFRKFRNTITCSKCEAENIPNELGYPAKAVSTQSVRQ